jgi:RPA family protein
MSESDDGGPGRREVAYRLFATEFDDADLEHSDSDEERAPNYVITPTGGRVNRLFAVGVLTEVEPVSDDVLRGRVVDPTGAFVLYAGQYQPDERAVLDRTDPPAFVAVTGKARTFQPEDGDRIFTSVRPESISEVDADTRDRWTVDAAAHTLHRVEAMATALAHDGSGDRLKDALVDRGYDEGLAAGIDLAIQHYGTTPTYLAAVRDLARDAARHVAGELDEVPDLSADPAESGDVTAQDILAGAVEPLGDAAEPEVVEASEPPGDGPGEATPATASEDEPAEPADPATEATSEPAEGEPGEFDLDHEEREQIEAEYGTEFQSGTEVDEPGEADIEAPEPEPEAVDATPATGTAHESEATPDSTEHTEEVELEDAVVEAMAELDDGDGATRTSVVETVAERHEVEPDAVEDAIQAALMDGRCYEPDEETLKPI